MNNNYDVEKYIYSILFYSILFYTTPKLEKAGLSISEKTNFFSENSDIFLAYFRVAKTALDLCTSKFLVRRF